ncbi:ATP-binding protein [Cardinium endosymbiont of Culicoides punctatus]|uniref:DNA polymerase III subunit n=1 Tax=Cardinium endosymbiont of Culicoides punctatus TaxID=2304601 RepID=UPI0010586BC7|nr:DNA polymerase III subunit delta [Cardinium endosymbiont of Culicoides punctatus]TDG95621.1 DNA polymerase III subunit tau [Cardinium endosymbiont of Culicoides punctatus]
MRFTDIPEHYALKNNLSRTVNINKVAHAQLFVGPVGSANLALALAFATYLNCTTHRDGDACGSCPSCTSMAQLTHPDLQLIFPRKSLSSIYDNQSESKCLDIFRNCLRDNPFLTIQDWSAATDYDSKQCQITKKDASNIIQRLSLKAFIGQYKIVLMWLPEYLNHTAANALLKTLEEPPLRTVFLLVSFDSEKILPTIKSRTQQHHIPLFSEEAIQQILRDKYSNLDINQYREIAFLAAGDVHKAFQLIEQPITDHFERFSNWMRNCYSNSFSKLIMQSEAFHKLSTDVQKAFFTYTLQMLRVTLLNNLNHTHYQEISNTEAVFIKKFSQNVSVNQIKNIIYLILENYNYLERNANAKMIYTHLSIQIVDVFNV